jgi:hypothetical protein
MMKEIKKYAEVIEANIVWENAVVFKSEIISRFSGRKIECVFRLRSNKRTTAQNSYLWGVAYSILALAFTEWNGEEFTSKDIHSFCKEEFLKKVMGSKYKEAKGANGETIYMAFTTTKLTTIEFNKYKELIQHWASKQDIQIPDPDEKFPDLKEYRGKERLIDIDKSV